MNKRDLMRIVADETDEPIGTVGKIVKNLFLEMKESLTPVEILQIVLNTSDKATFNKLLGDLGAKGFVCYNVGVRE